MFLQCINTDVKDEFKIAGHEVLNGKAKPTGNGAHVLVPRDWIGANVKVVRATEPGNNGERH